MMLLSLIIFMPIIAGIFLMLFANFFKANTIDEKNQYNPNSNWMRWYGLGASLLTLIASIYLLVNFKVQAGYQFVEKALWIPAWNVNYHLGVDGISIWLVVLTTFTTSLIMLAGWQVIKERVADYYALFLIICGLTTGAFVALDGLLFYAFFEFSLIPMYLIIGIWGGKNRVYAAFKFFLYTLVGSLLLLAAMIYLANQAGGFGIEQWYALKLSMQEQMYLFAAFFIAFAVKVPMWPFHTWLPDAHVEAPTGGSMLLAALMLKLGTYGLLRYVLPIFPDASQVYAPYIIALSLVAIVYIGLVALAQTDMKKLVAYSSIAHMGFVTLGLFLFDEMGIAGAIIQMISHGFVSSAMFFCIGVLYDRVHSRNINDYGGVVNVMPKFAAFSLLFAMANCGLPLTSGFVGEIMVLVSATKYQFWIGLLAGTTLILSAAYSLWMYKRVVFGALNTSNLTLKHLNDINKREFLILAILAIMVIWMGVYPKFFMDLIYPSLHDILQTLQISKL